MQSLRIVTANADFNRGGTRLYIAYLRALTGRGLLCLQGFGHGVRSTRIRRVNLPKRAIDRLPRWIVGKVGAHRGIARARVTINGQKVVVYSIHGLHVRTMGRGAQDAFYAKVQRRIHARHQAGKRTIVAGDFNIYWRTLAKRLGMTGIGHGVDGILISAGLEFTDDGIDTHGIKRGWTDHPALWADITTTRPRKEK